MLVQVWQEGFIRIMNIGEWDQVLAEGTTLVCYEPVKWETTTRLFGTSNSRDSTAQWTAARGDVQYQAKPQHWRDTEVGEAGIFTKSNIYGWNNKVHHCIDTGNTHSISQPLVLTPVKQAVVDMILKDMKGWGVVEETESPWSSSFMLVR